MMGYASAGGRIPSTSTALGLGARPPTRFGLRLQTEATELPRGTQRIDRLSWEDSTPNWRGIPRVRSSVVA